MPQRRARAGRPGRAPRAASPGRARAAPLPPPAPPASPSIDHVEEAHPAEVRELGLVRVEHEPAGVVELDLEHAALALAEHHGVGVLPVVARAGGLVAEEVAV